MRDPLVSAASQPKASGEPLESTDEEGLYRHANTCLSLLGEILGEGVDGDGATCANGHERAGREVRAVRGGIALGEPVDELRLDVLIAVDERLKPEPPGKFVVQRELESGAVRVEGEQRVDEQAYGRLDWGVLELDERVVDERPHPCDMALAQGTDDRVAAVEVLVDSRT